MLRAVRSPRAAFFAAALVACVWLNQGPSSRRYEALVTQAGSSESGALRAWLPFAFAYRRSADEELYFAIANAIRGASFDREILLRKRGDSSPAFRRAPAADGHWHMPYGEVPFEYPALLLPFILLPAALSPSFEIFAPLFGVLMAALMLASIQLAILAGPRRTDSDRAKMWWWAAAMMLAQGGLLVQRLDPVATLFLALGLWASVRRRPVLMGLSVALAAAAKITPILAIVPLCLADRAIWRSRAALTRAALGLSLGLGAGFLPMLLMSPQGFGDFVRYHGARGLQIESTYGTVVSIVRSICGDTTGAVLSFGSYNLAGPVADALASVSPFILVAAILGFGAWLARAPGRPLSATDQARLVAGAGLGALLCIWLLGKVFSPQYLTWGIPFAVALSARRTSLLLIVAMAIAQAYLRGFYDVVVAMQPLGVAALAARSAVLLAMAVALLRTISALGNRREPSAKPS